MGGLSPIIVWRTLAALSVLGVFTAGNFCPQGWDWEPVQNICYLYVDRFVTWSAAKKICNDSSSSLVEIDSEAKNALVHRIMRAHGAQTGIWLNIDDIGEEGHWVLSSTQQPLPYSNWIDGEPNDLDGEDCGI